MKFLVVGAGSIGSRHARNLLSMGHTVIMSDSDSERGRSVAAEIGATFADDGMGLELDGVFVCSPSSLHLSQLRTALEHGQNVFVEKPVAVSLEGTAAVLALAREKGSVVMCGFNLRYDTGLLKVKELLPSIGTVVSVLSVAGQYLPDQRPGTDYRNGYGAQAALGGGVLLDGIHELDYQFWLFGKAESVACHADKRTDLEIDTEDNCSLLVKYACGVKGLVQMDYVKRAYQRFCHIIGDQGTLIWDFVLGEVRHYDARTQEWRTYPPTLPWKERVNKLYVDEVADFCSLIEKGVGDVRSLEEAIYVLQLAVAAKESAVKGETVRV